MDYTKSSIPELKVLHKREFNSWSNMRNRCNNEKHTVYKYYGGRGIKVCDQWLGKEGFRSFLIDMGTRPEGYTLDRIDSEGDYTPGNCRWATLHTQQSNQRHNKEHPGVYFHNRDKRWRAKLYVNKKCVLDSSYKTIDEALLAREAAELKYLGVLVRNMQ